MTLEFEKPDDVLARLCKEYDCPKPHLLRAKLKGAKSKEDRELYYGALFAKALNKINKHEYFIRLPEKDEDCDVELLNNTQHQLNQKLPKDKRKPDHFLVQNVQITEYDVKDALEKGKSNIIYDIFSDHLERTKLSPRAGDYSGCILVFYPALKLEGQIGLVELRRMARATNQDKFKEIWVLIPNRGKYGIAELCHMEGEFGVVDFEDLA